MQERPPGTGGRRSLDVGVLEHDQRAVAAEFEHGPLQQPARGLTDDASGRRRSGERDHPDVRILDERLADLGAAGDDVQDAGGQARLLEEARDQDAAGDGRVEIALQHHGVPEGKRRSERPHREDDREVPRRDHADHADRSPARRRGAPRHRRGQLPLELVGGQGCSLLELADRGADLVCRLPFDRARLADHPAGDLLAVQFEELPGAAHDRDPLGHRQSRPRRAERGRPIRRRGDGAAFADAGASERLAGGGIGRVDRLRGVDPSVAEDLPRPLLVVEEVRDCLLGRTHVTAPRVRWTRWVSALRSSGSAPLPSRRS